MSCFLISLFGTMNQSPLDPVVSGVFWFFAWTDNHLFNTHVSERPDSRTWKLMRILFGKLLFQPWGYHARQALEIVGCWLMKRHPLTVLCFLMSLLDRCLKDTIPARRRSRRWWRTCLIHFVPASCSVPIVSASWKVKVSSWWISCSGMFRTS